MLSLQFLHLLSEFLDLQFVLVFTLLKGSLNVLFSLLSLSFSPLRLHLKLRKLTFHLVIFFHESSVQFSILFIGLQLNLLAL